MQVLQNRLCSNNSQILSQATLSPTKTKGEILHAMSYSIIVIEKNYSYFKYMYTKQMAKSNVMCYLHFCNKTFKTGIAYCKMSSRTMTAKHTVQRHQQEQEKFQEVGPQASIGLGSSRTVLMLSKKLLEAKEVSRLGRYQ